MSSVLSSSTSVSADIRQMLMLFSTTWLVGSRGFSFSITTWRQHKVDGDKLWTLPNRMPLEINGSDANIAQLQTTVKKRGNHTGGNVAPPHAAPG